MERDESIMKAELKISTEVIEKAIREYLEDRFVGKMDEVEFDIEIEQRESYNEAILKGAKIKVDLIILNQKTPPVINLREVPDDIPNYKYQK